MRLNKNYMIGVLVSLVCVGFFLKTTWIHMDLPIQRSDDVAYYYFLFDNNFSKLARGDVSHLFDTRMFYPRQNTLALGNSVLGPSVLGLPVYIATRNTVVAANTVFLLNFFLSFLFMFLLTYQLTRSLIGSLIAGLVFTYNPYIISRLHPDLSATQWIPLIFLAAEMLFKRVTWRWALIFSIAFLFQLTTSFYYFLFVAVCFPIYAVIRMKQKHLSWRHVFHVAFGAALIVFLCVAVWYMRPFLAVRNEYRITTPQELNQLYSASIADYLFTTPENVMYGNIGTLPIFAPLRGEFARAHPYEHSLFPGLLAAFAFLVCLWVYITRVFSPQNRSVITAYLVLIVVSFLLTFIGPYTLLYKLPFVDALRVPTRFVVITLFGLSVCIAFLWTHWRSRSAVVMGIILFILIAGEYRYTFPKPETESPSVREFYSELEARQDVHVLLELPIGNGYAIGNPLLDRDFIEDTPYLYYATYHNKQLVNGYHGYIPPDYYVWGRVTAIDFPTRDKLEKMKSLGIDTIVVHLDEYRVGQIGDGLILTLQAQGLKEILHVGSLYAFAL